jgi:hypothetical protein
MLLMGARAIVPILAVAVFAGCPTKPEPAVPPAEGDAPAETPALPDDPGQPDPVEPTPSGSVADGGACLRAEDCSSGICEGEGCDDAHPGKCVPSDRMCTRDARSYCGCDGKTFVGSGSCPERRYRSASACEGDPGPIGQ